MHRQTKAAIVKELKALANRCKAGDKVYFHFSGHGQPVTDINGDEGSKGYDEAIVPYDACKTKTSRVKCQWYNGENHLIDDELNPLFAKIKGKLGGEWRTIHSNRRLLQRRYGARPRLGGGRLAPDSRHQRETQRK